MTTQKYIDIAGSMFVPTVVLVDSSGVPYTAGGGGGGLSDTILTDDSNTQFLARDNGTTITYVTLSGAAYTPSTNIRALSVTVTGAATSAKQDTGNTSLAALVANTPAANADGGSPTHITNFPASQTVAGSVTVSNLPATQAVSGSVAVSNFPSSQAVTGAFFQATQPISGGTSLVDGVTPSLKATVAAFHNSDNQSLGATSYGLNTGGVAQLLNSTGNLDRQRETGSDNVPASGIATGTQQLAAGINVTTSAAITLSASAQTVVLSALSVTVRGSLASIQVGSNVVIDTGTNQESVYVTAVNTTNKSITAIFTKSHASGVAAVSFAYNQARDSTAPDGSPAVGFAAGSMYLFNASLNSGVGGLEIERSAAGELDGANGAGTAVAAEYEFNAGGPMSGGVPSGLSFDRARNLQGKGMGATTSSAATSVGVTSITLTSVVGLLAGMQIRLDRNTATEEAGYVAATYVTGSLTVGLQSATAFAHASGAVAEWDIFASGGPGLSGFTPAGVGIDEEVLYDPVTKLYYIERAATQDNMAPQNVVVECLGLWNGTGFDRATGTTANGLLVKTSNGALETGGVLSQILTKVTNPLAVTGAFYQATQPVSGSVSVSNFPSTQVVSGTVTANVGTTNGLGLDTSLQQIKAAIQATVSLTGTVWYDATVTPVIYYVRREVDASGAITIVWENPAGGTATPTVANLQAVSNSQNIASENVIYSATAAGTGYVSGDVLIHAFGIDTVTTPATVAYSVWMNAGPSVASGSIISAPTTNTYSQAGQSTVVTQSALPSGAAQETGNLAQILTKLSSALTVAGSVSVSNLPATQAVTGTFYQTTQPVSGSVSITNLPSTQAVTGTFYQATQPISGSVSVGNFPSTQPVSLASVPLPTGAATLAGQGTINADLGIQVHVMNNPSAPAGVALDGTDATGVTVPTGGVGIRGWLSGIYKAVTGTLAVSGSVSVSNLPASQAVTGTFFPSTQPVSAVSLPLPTGAAQESSGNLASIATTNTTMAVRGQQTSAQSTSVVFASDGLFSQAIGAASDTVATTDTGTFSLLSLTKRSLTSLTTLLARVPSLVGGYFPVTTRMAGAAFASGTLTSNSAFVVSMLGGPLPASITLKSSASGRLVQLSTDGGTEYFTPSIDVSSSTMQIIAVSTSVTNVKFVGVTNDTWSVI